MAKESYKARIYALELEVRRLKKINKNNQLRIEKLESSIVQICSSLEMAHKNASAALYLEYL